MSGVLDDPNEYMKNPLFKNREFGDYSAFYITVTVCTLFGFTLFLLNIFFCWCSQHRQYWLDSNTGNRWIFALWTKTPYKQPPLDLTELRVEEVPTSWTGGDDSFSLPEEYVELQDKPKQQMHTPSKESDL